MECCRLIANNKVFILKGSPMRIALNLLRRLIVTSLVLPVVFLTCAQAEDLVDFTLNDFVTKQQVSTASFRGKCMLIIFGSIYCKPCVQMLPVVRKLRDIDVTSEEEKIHQFIKDQQIRHLYLIDTLRVAKLNKVFTLPTTLIVNSKGGIEKRFMGFQDYDKLEGTIKKALDDIKR
jgi:thioredoxin-related protein